MQHCFIAEQIFYRSMLLLAVSYNPCTVRVNFKELGIEHPDIELLVKKLHENKGELVGNYVKLNKEYSKEIFELACK